MRHVDLTVVGGGFAGMACAIAAGNRGVHTQVIDRRPRPGHQPHTTGLIVKELADEWDVPRRVTRKIGGVRLYSPNLHYVDLHRPGYYFLATDTSALLRWWAEQARGAGAAVRFDTAYHGATCTDDGFALDGGRTTTRYIVGADGARSAVGRSFGLPGNSRLLRGVEIEFLDVRGVPDDLLHVFLDSALAPGYIAWVIPGHGVTQVGLATRQGKPLRLGQFIEKISALFDFTRARRIGDRAGVIPCGGTLRSFGREGVLLVGDAAGMVSPLTGGGIHTAVHYGRVAGIAIADHLLDDGPDPYTVMRRCAPRFGSKRLIRMAYDLNPPNALYNLMLSSPVLRAVAQTVFFHHRGLLSPAAWRDLAQLAVRC